MAAQDVFYSILIRRDTTENWNENNPVLNLAELGLDVDKLRLKAGDGVSSWNDLPYLNFLDQSQLYSLIRLLTNMDDNNIIFSAVQTEDDIYIHCKDPKNRDLVFVIDEEKFYIYNDNTWRSLTVDDVGGDVTKETVKVIFNELIEGRIVSLLTNSESKIPSAGQVYRLNEKIKENKTEQTKRIEKLEEKVEEVYNKDKIITDVYVDQNSNDSLADGSSEKPYKTLSAAIDSIPVTSHRNARTVNIHILSNLNITTSEFIIPSIVGVSRFIISSDNNSSLYIMNNNTKSVEVDMTLSPVVFNNLTFNFRGNSYGFFLNLGSKVMFTNCTFNSVSGNTYAILGTDKMCNLVIDNCKFNTNMCRCCVYLDHSNGSLLNSELNNSQYGVILDSSLCITNNNSYNVLLHYFQQLDSSQII